MKINKNQLIYVVDDDAALNAMICKHLQSKGFKSTKGLMSGEELLEAIDSSDEAIVVQDFNLAGMNGLETLKKAKMKSPKTEFVFLSGQSSIEIAVEAIKNGAFDYIIKDNFAKDNVTTKINNLLKIKALSFDRKAYRGLMVIFIVLLIVSWLTVFILFYNK